MAEYIDKNHFDERIRVAVGMSEGDLTSDFKDGVLFALHVLKTEDSADVVEREKIDKAIKETEDLDPITERVGLQVKQEILNILKRNIGD